jgi:hypothetical protein
MVNADALTTVANSGLVRLSGGSLCVFTSQPTDVLVDVSGWIASTGLRTTPVAPVRLVDTRPGQMQAVSVAQNRVRGGQLLAVDVASWSGFDPTASAVTLNVTAAGPSGDGFLTVLPGPCAGVALPPTTSNLNVTTGRDVAASATTALGDGEVCIFTSVETDVILDLQALHGATGGTLTALDPRRIADTRMTSRLARGQSLPIQLDSAVAAVVVNLTAVDPSASGYLALHPCDSAVPTVSNLNVVAGATIANRGVVSTGGTNRFCVYSSVDTEAVIDLEGFITPS